MHCMFHSAFKRRERSIHVYTSSVNKCEEFTTIFRTVFGSFNIHMFPGLIGMIMLCNDQLFSSNTH